MSSTYSTDGLQSQLMFSSATETVWHSHIHHLSLSPLGIPCSGSNARRTTSSSKENKKEKNALHYLSLSCSLTDQYVFASLCQHYWGTETF